MQMDQHKRIATEFLIAEACSAQRNHSPRRPALRERQERDGDNSNSSLSSVIENTAGDVLFGGMDTCLFDSLLGGEH